MEFPQYRKLSNNLSFYKITSVNGFVEIQKIGDSIVKHHIEATQYPEKLRIKDMLELTLPHLLHSTEKEFLALEKESFRS